MSDEIFDRNKPSGRISAALRLLEELKLAYCRKEPTAGRPVKWFATA